jgi:RNA polymerase sigma factor (sigma-70 family)
MLEIRTCVARLPRQDQQVLFLSLAEGLKPGEIAARLGLSAEVVRQQKSRALKRLKEMLDGPSRIGPREPHSNR